ncbi:iron-containing alcohol dehydrogenase, partial [Arthrospira platensis SPKY1]|nr:iron-containing alcohol dehydrogenase [Arthrospira platensis SPKY1]
MYYAPFLHANTIFTYALTFLYDTFLLISLPLYKNQNTMLNFEWYNPVNYIFGEGQISKLSELLPKDTKIMLAYGGGSIFKNGIYEQIKEATHGLDFIEFGGIEPNPRYETLMKAVEVIREQNIGFILAVGGGSVIDGVKFISGAVHFQGDALDILRKRILFK